MADVNPASVPTAMITGILKKKRIKRIKRKKNNCPG
jgi:hypothetical protein